MSAPFRVVKTGEGDNFTNLFAKYSRRWIYTWANYMLLLTVDLIVGKGEIIRVYSMIPTIIVVAVPCLHPSNLLDNCDTIYTWKRRALRYVA